MFVEMLHRVLVYLSVFCLFFLDFYAKTVMLYVWKLDFFFLLLAWLMGFLVECKA